MKRSILVFFTALALTLFLVPPTLAQHGERGMMARSDSMPGKMMGRMTPGMMQGGMMGQGMMQMMQGMHQQMMRNPMHRASMMTFMLPALADTLGLSDRQVEQINELKGKAMTQRQEHREQMMAQRKEFMGLFEGDQQPASDAVGQHLSAMAEMRARRQSATFETAQQMRQVLTDEQRQTLAGLTPQQKMRQVMSRMPMMDMMKMMRSMHGGMMQGGMMQMKPMHQRGMMHQGGMQKMPRHQNR